MEPPEFNKRLRLHLGDGRVEQGLVVSYDYQFVYVLWDDGDLIPMSYEDLADLREAGSIEVDGEVPVLVFKRDGDERK